MLYNCLHTVCSYHYLTRGARPSRRGCGSCPRFPPGHVSVLAGPIIFPLDLQTLHHGKADCWPRRAGAAWARVGGRERPLATNIVLPRFWSLRCPWPWLSWVDLICAECRIRSNPRVPDAASAGLPMADLGTQVLTTLGSAALSGQITVRPSCPRRHSLPALPCWDVPFR